jgi:tetratricopeptide (TPR) repeat protein
MTLTAKSLSVILALFLMPWPAVAGTLDKAELWRLHVEGEASFRQGNELSAGDPEGARALYEKAILSFERIVREGAVENGKLYYNIGNVYFRLGEPGKAILNYRKAERLIPGDLNLQQNLMYARSRCVDKIDPKPRTRVLQTLFFYHYDLSPLTRTVLFVVFFGCIWVCAALHLFFGRRWLKGVGLVFGVLSLLLAGSLAVEATLQSGPGSGVVLAKEVVARKGDSATYEPSFKEPLHAGTEFILIEVRKDWYQIELPDGRRCWIPLEVAGLL